MDEDRGLGLILKMQRAANARAERGQAPRLWSNINNGFLLCIPEAKADREHSHGQPPVLD